MRVVLSDIIINHAETLTTQCVGALGTKSSSRGYKMLTTALTAVKMVFVLKLQV